jgi:hypothetical protein
MKNSAYFEGAKAALLAAAHEHWIELIQELKAELHCQLTHREGQASVVITAGPGPELASVSIDSLVTNLLELDFDYPPDQMAEHERSMRQAILYRQKFANELAQQAQRLRDHNSFRLAELAKHRQAEFARLQKS